MSRAHKESFALTWDETDKAVEAGKTLWLVLTTGPDAGFLVQVIDRFYMASRPKLSQVAAKEHWLVYDNYWHAYGASRRIENAERKRSNG